MVTKTTPGQASGGPYPELLIREARRRQRRRQLIAGSATAVIAVAAVIAASLGGPGPPPRHPLRLPQPGSRRAAGHATALPPPIPRSIGTTVLMWPVGPVVNSAPDYVDDLSTGRLVQNYAFQPSVGDYQPLVAGAGRWIIYVGNGTTAIPDTLRGGPRVLSSTPFFALAASPNRVWVFRPGRYVWSSCPPSCGRVRAWDVPIAGGQPSPPVILPPGAHWPAIRGTDAGLLLATQRDLELWRPGTAPRILPHSPSDPSDGFDATARLIAWGTGCAFSYRMSGSDVDACQVLRVLDVATGHLYSFDTPAGTAGWVPLGFDLVSAISPTNRLIAAYAVARPQRAGRLRLYLVRTGVRSRPVTAVPASLTTNLGEKTAWSPNGTWLLFQGPGGRLWAYQVRTGAIRSSTTPCCYGVMLAMPSSG